MSDKVKLPKEIATYIEDLLIAGTNEMLIAGVLGNANSPKYTAVRKHFDGDFDSLLKALVNSYEVEETPEDKVRAYIKSRRKEFSSFCEGTEHYWRARGKYDGAIAVVEIMGIDLSGVNAE